MALQDPVLPISAGRSLGLIDARIPPSELVSGAIQLPMASPSQRLDRRGGEA